jgi:YbbR domain-containing protein
VIRKSVDGDAPDELHLDLDPEDVDLPPDVSVIVRDVQPRSVTLRFESQAQRMVPVRSALRFVADSGITPGAARLEPDSVTVIGDRRLVGKLEFVSTVANDIVIREAMDVVVQLDTGNLGVRVTPSVVRVTVPVRRTAPAPPAEASRTPRRGGQT